MNRILNLVCALCVCCAHVSFAQEITPKSNLKDIVEQGKANAQRLIEFGRKMRAEGETSKAIYYFQEASKSAPYDFRPFWEMVRIYMTDGHMDEAFKVMEQAGIYHQDNDKFYTLIDELDQKLYPAKAKDTNALLSIADFKDNKMCAVSFNFDDGAKRVATDILPLFDEYGFKATIPVNPGTVEEDSARAIWGSWEDWQSAHARGFEIANHSLNHRDLTLLTDQELDEEINTSFDVIKEKIAVEPISFIFPFNKSDYRALRAIGRRHSAIRHHDYLKQIYPHIFLAIYGGDYFSAQTANRIVNMALRHNVWLVVEAHSVKTEIPTYKPLTLNFLNEHLQFLKDNESKIWVDTFGNVYRYLTLKKSSTLEQIDDSDTHLTFELKARENTVSQNTSLTVIVRPKADALDEVTVIRLETGEQLSFKKTESGELYIDLVPGGGPVTVRW